MTVWGRHAGQVSALYQVRAEASREDNQILSGYSVQFFMIE